MSIRRGIAAAMLLTLGACASRQPVATAPRMVQVPAGTPFVATLDDTLGTRISAPGQRFAMHLETPLRAADGSVVVPVNAMFIGRVGGVTQGVHPGVQIADVALVTSMGLIPLQVSVRNPDASAPRETSMLSISMMPPVAPRILSPAPASIASADLLPGQNPAQGTLQSNGITSAPIASAGTPAGSASSITSAGMSRGSTYGSAQRPLPPSASVPAPAVTATLSSPPGALGGGPQAAVQPEGAEIAVPAGAHLNLVLDAPFAGAVPPGATP